MSSTSSCKCMYMYVLVQFSQRPLNIMTFVQEGICERTENLIHFSNFQTWCLELLEVSFIGLWLEKMHTTQYVISFSSLIL